MVRSTRLRIVDHRMRTRVSRSEVATVGLLQLAASQMSAALRSRIVVERGGHDREVVIVCRGRRVLASVIFPCAQEDHQTIVLRDSSVASITTIAGTIEIVDRLATYLDELARRSPWLRGGERAEKTA